MVSLFHFHLLFWKASMEYRDCSMKWKSINSENPNRSFFIFKLSHNVTFCKCMPLLNDICQKLHNRRERTATTLVMSRNITTASGVMPTELRTILDGRTAR